MSKGNGNFVMNCGIYGHAYNKWRKKSEIVIK